MDWTRVSSLHRALQTSRLSTRPTMTCSSSRITAILSSRSCLQATSSSTTSCRRLSSRTRDSPILPTSVSLKLVPNHNECSSNSILRSIPLVMQQYEEEGLLWPKCHFQAHRFRVIHLRHYQAIHWIQWRIHCTGFRETIREFGV
jgi:hypothetical protein